MHERQVVFRGQDDVHAHAAKRREIERGDERIVRQEIRRDNFHGSLRLGQRGEQRPARVFKIRVRPVGDDSGDGFAAFFQFWKPDFAVENFVRRERPIIGKGFLQFRDDRAFDAEMQILHGIFWFVGEDVSVADVHAAGEAGLAVHDERLAMVAKIDGGHAPRREDGRRQESGERNFCAPQFPGDRRERIARAGGINEHAHGHAALDGAFERGDEFFSARVVVENVGAERDGFFRGFNRGEHRWKRFVAVDQRLDFISRRERLRGDAADDAGDVLEMFRAVVLRFTEIFGNVAAESFMHAEFDGAAADAVDAEREVEQGTERGQKPDDGDPDCRGARVAFVEQGVAGGEQAGEQVKTRRDVRPEAGNFFKPVHRWKTLRALGGWWQAFLVLDEKPFV